MQTNKKHKDRLFKFIFGNEEHKEWTLSLYNALNGSNYTDPEIIEFTTIDDVIYMGTKNDVSLLVMIDSTMELWEQQSSFNPNLPVRFLVYAGQLYDKYMTEKDIYRYGRRLNKLPKPKCICFYNGTGRQPEERILRLSDAFGAYDGDIEVTVRMLNINYGRNKSLMEACKSIEEYAWLIDRIRGNQKTMGNVDAAVDKAIAEMPDDFLLKRFLTAHKAEVKGMYLTEYDEEKERRHAIREGREEGREEGRAEGRAEGRNEEKERVARDMLRKNLPLTLIEEISRLSEEAIRALAANLGLTVV